MGVWLQLRGRKRWGGAMQVPIMLAAEPDLAKEVVFDIRAASAARKAATAAAHQVSHCLLQAEPDNSSKFIHSARINSDFLHVPSMVKHQRTS